MTIRILLGGSPCTHWSIAQKNERETEAEGIGWELFKNYLIAKEKFQPDYFLYENNKSAAKPIKDQIAHEFKAWNGTLMDGEDNGVRFTYINSALVSAQNRQRFYVTNFGDIAQPEDRGILLKDILESGEVPNEKSYCLKHQAGNARDYFKKHHTNVAFEKPETEPIRIGTIGSESQAHRVYSSDGKSINLVANGGGQGAKTGLYATPVAIGYRGRMHNGKWRKQYEAREDNKANALTTAQTDSMVAEKKKGSKKIYEVKDGLICINDVMYPIKLSDGFYIIRKLTVTECCRLQTMEDSYCKAVSSTQAYKGLGNGWTAEVIIHLLNHVLKDVPRDEPIEVLSMYDGIGTGRYVLDKMGFINITYKAYEIDKYAMQIANDNYPDIIQCGDAFQIRDDGWNY